MNKLFLFALSMTSLSLWAQNNRSVTTKHDLQFIQQFVSQKSTDTEMFADLQRRFPIHKFDGIDFLSFIAKVDENFKETQFEKLGIIKGSRINNLLTFRVPLSALASVDLLEGIQYYEIAEKIIPELDKAIKDVHADSVQKGIGLPIPYTGKDVYIGITDWGFDYMHPNYYDTTLTQTRIAAAWDQYKTSGPHPANYNYGTEYDTPGELLAAQSDTANIYGYALHGSHVAGICGGSGGGTPYRGVAFESKFLFTTFLVDAAAVLDAYAWMYEKAQADSKRLVINQSWGLHYIGNLDGTSLLSQTIDAYSALGVVFVTSGGNNGARSFHLKREFANDTLRSKINFYDYSFPTMWGQSITIWGQPGKSFSTSIQVFDVSNNLLGETPFYNTALTSNYVDSMLITGTDTIFFNISAENANPQNARPHMRFRVKNENTMYKVVLQVTATDGVVHCWNVVELTNGVGNWGLAFVKSKTNQSQGDNNYGIGEPACSQSTIAVAAYTTGADIASFSSYGPTMDDRIKPDISAPGVDIASSISSFTDNDYTLLTSVDFNGRTYPFGRLSGTSMSGPMITGIVALLLQANPYLSAYQVKDVLRATARTDAYTGAIPAEGSLRWGAGKVNAYQALLLALQTIGNVDVPELKSDLLQVYPNPASDVLTLSFPHSLEGATVQLMDQQGKITKLQIANQQLDLSDLAAGSYVLHVVHEAKVYQKKIVKK